MQPRAHLFFSPFHLDLVSERLWHGEQRLALRPKLFTLLRYLVAHAGQLVTKEELLQEGWPHTYGSQGLLKGCMRELRRTLGDDAEVPRFIETIGRRGYRFIAPFTTAPATASLMGYPAHHTMVGRETELEQLHGWLNEALAGERQVVFVTGEPGIGKTTVVDTFLAQIEAGLHPCALPGSTQAGAHTAIHSASWSEIWIAQGRCIEHYGAGEAYLPVLEALGRLCREAGGERLTALLGHHAPTWLVQMPALVSDVELEGLQRKVQGATRERMLRELAEALEALTVETPLILVLEDLQWSDYSTIDLLACLAQRRGRLLLIGTYRPAEVIVSAHPLRGLKQELQVHRQCAEVALRFLTSAEVSQYLQGRFPQHQFPPALARVIHQRTDGNPLFMVNVVDDLVAQRVISAEDEQWQLVGQLEERTGEAPESLRQLIDKQLDRLTAEDQRVLEAASVAGATFAAAAVAAGVEAEVGAVEEHCERLARQGQFLQARGGGGWPDGTVAGHYEFLHALYQQVLYERSAAGRRIGLHRRIGTRKEAAYGERAREIAAELAVHFEQGQEPHKAIQYRQHAGENAFRRHAYSEAMAHFRHGLALLHTLPDTPGRIQQELALLIPLGVSLTVVEGFVTPAVKTVYTRAYEFCQQVPHQETSQRFSVLLGLWRYHFVSAEHPMSRQLAEQLLTIAQPTDDPVLLIGAHQVLAFANFYLGEPLVAREHFDQEMVLYHHAPQLRSIAHLHGIIHGVVSLAHTSFPLWYLGYPEQALRYIQEALALAQENSHPHSVVFALNFAATIHQLRGEVQAARERATAAIALATEHGFPTWNARATILAGWALAAAAQHMAGIAQIRQGLDAYGATGTQIDMPYSLALLAEAYGKAGQPAEGLRVLGKAVARVTETDERFYEAELCRLQGELLWQAERQAGGKAAPKQHAAGVHPASCDVPSEECFWHAIAIARRQSAKSLELRAVLSLCRLWQQQGKHQEAYDLLAPIYGWFTEGFDTADLQEAKALLKALEGFNRSA